MAMPRKERTRLNSHAMIFSTKELCFTLGITAVLVLFVLPFCWMKLEKPQTGKDFRLSYKQRDNYYLYELCVKKLCRQYPAVFLGDSVIWGMFSDNENTLPALLNRKLRKEYVANLSIDGLHYIALETLLKEYGSAIRGKHVFLYFNPLWLNSKQFDLSGDGEFNINHPRLLPQFDFSIRSYQAPLAKRMSALIEHNVLFYRWLNHLRVSFCDNADFKTCAVEHASENPFAKLTLSIDPSEKDHQNGTKTWKDAGIPEQDWKWVPLAESKQYAAYLRIIRLLQKHNCNVTAVIGAINPYVLTPESRKGVHALRDALEKELRARKIDCIMLPELESGEYADASHPLISGYRKLAEFMSRKLEKKQKLRNRAGNSGII